MTQRIDTNARVAWANAYDSGIRTQAAADMAESGCKVQTGKKQNSGGSHNDHYWPIYATIERLGREQPTLVAVGHWLCLSNEGEANQHLDDVADAILDRYVSQVGAGVWMKYRKTRKQRVEAIIQARMTMERRDMCGEQPKWQPTEVAFYCREIMGVSIVVSQWKRDGWDDVWSTVGDIIRDLEIDAMEPIHHSISRANKLIRQEWQEAA